MTFIKKAIEAVKKTYRKPETPTTLYPSVLNIPNLPEPELYFNKDGWLVSDNFVCAVEHQPLECLYWEGMHPVIQLKYENKLIGTVTHYTALGDGRQTSVRFHRHDKNKKNGRDYRSVSTHFIICRDGHIIQLVSIHNRTWHAARRGLQFIVPSTRDMPSKTSRNPNHWFVGVDFANWGRLLKGSINPQTWTKQTFRGPIYHDKSTRSYWENYTPVQMDSYVALMQALVKALDMDKSCHFGHSDIDPKNKIDPGPALPFEELIERVYAEDNFDNYSYFEERAGNESDV